MKRSTAVALTKKALHIAAATPDDTKEAIDDWLGDNLGRAAREFRVVPSKSSERELVYEGTIDIGGTKVGIGIEFEW